MKMNKPAIKLTLSKTTVKNLAVKSGTRTGQIVWTSAETCSALCTLRCPNV
jgi:hypothetical protein